MVKSRLRFEYATVGHVTADVLSDGTRRAGGTALYAALQASRLGLETLIVTRGVPAEVEGLLEPYAGELEVRVIPAAATTTLQTTGSGSARRQRMLAWAGELSDDLDPESAIVHLAPVARETPASWRRRSTYLGLTPQGLARSWRGLGEEVTPSRPAPEQEELAGLCDAIVLSESEQECCTQLISGAIRGGGTVAITAGVSGAALRLADGRSLRVDGPLVEDPADDLGAGDVFAAALFVALYEGRPPARAGAFAAAAAAVRLSGVGAAAVGDRVAIERRLESG
jgi:sugar/nucleoside kinase (ribokinase family)